MLDLDGIHNNLELNMCEPFCCGVEKFLFVIKLINEFIEKKQLNQIFESEQYNKLYEDEKDIVKLIVNLMDKSNENIQNRNKC